MKVFICLKVSIFLPNFIIFVSYIFYGSILLVSYLLVFFEG